MHAELDRRLAGDVFAADDYYGALTNRDRIEHVLTGTFVDRAGPAALDAIDELFRSFTVSDDDGLVRLTGGPGDRWWWYRVPRSGPVILELRERKRALG